MKTVIMSAMLLLGMVINMQAAEKPVVISIDTPSSGWSVKIQSAHTLGDKLLIVCQLSPPDGASAGVISQVKDSIQLAEQLASKKQEIYVLGKTWNWGKGYTAVTPKELKNHLTDSKTVYTAKAENENKAPANKLKGDDSDFINLKLKEAEALAKKRKLKYRIIEKDGRPLPATLDHRPNRLNFVIKKGIVTHIRRG